VFRGKFLHYLKQAFQEGKLKFYDKLKDLANPAHFSTFIQSNRKIEWCVYAKAPFGGPLQVLDYLGRYTHRVAISNNRLLAFQDGKVTFQWKDYKNDKHKSIMTLDAHEFIRRFLIHILPRGFAKLRSFGFLANRHRRIRLSLCRQLLNAPPPEADPQLLDWKARHETLTGESLDTCPACHQGRMLLLQILPHLWKSTFALNHSPLHRIHSP
jgi:hypothetical protein